MLTLKMSEWLKLPPPTLPDKFRAQPTWTLRVCNVIRRTVKISELLVAARPSDYNFYSTSLQFLCLLSKFTENMFASALHYFYLNFRGHCSVCHFVFMSCGCSEYYHKNTIPTF